MSCSRQLVFHFFLLPPFSSLLEASHFFATTVVFGCEPRASSPLILQGRGREVRGWAAQASSGAATGEQRSCNQQLKRRPATAATGDGEAIRREATGFEVGRLLVHGERRRRRCSVSQLASSDLVFERENRSPNPTATLVASGGWG